MEFDLSPEQKSFRDSLDGILSHQLAKRSARDVADQGGFDADLWLRLTELGVTSLRVSEAGGGIDGSLLDMVVVGECIAGSAASIPYLGASVLAPAALQHCAQIDATISLLSGIASGNVRMAVAGVGDDAQVDGLDIQGHVASGVVPNVFESAGCTHLLCITRSNSVLVFDLEDEGIEAVTVPSYDATRPLSNWQLKDAIFKKFDVSGGIEMGERLLDLACVVLAADTLGSSQAMLDRAVEYSKERFQFGRPIGSFQSVKHLCADMITALEPCRALIWYAAHAQDINRPDASLLASQAIAHLSEVGQEIANTATLIHGAIGFTDELGLHLWFKRIGANRQVLGQPERHRRRAARIQGWGVA